MDKLVKQGIIAALEGVSTQFSTEELNDSAINAILEKCGLDANSNPRDFRAVEATAFAIIEEAVDEILPKRLDKMIGRFAEIKTFARDAEVLFNIDKLGKNRAKLTITEGARGGVYRSARLDSATFTVPTRVQTAGLYVTLEDILLGTITLAELFKNILEGFEENLYKQVFNALASGEAVANYGRIGGNIETVKADLNKSIDKVMPTVKQYGTPMIFGSSQALDGLYNPATATNINVDDAHDLRNHGIVQTYKGVKIVEIPNHLMGTGNDTWLFDINKVFVIPGGAKPVKVALKGQMYINKDTNAVGGEAWNAHKMIGVGLAMANNYAVISLTDVK